MTAHLVLTLATLLTAQTGALEPTADPGSEARGTRLQPAPPSPTPEGLGGLYAPVVLPRGALATYGYVGVPEIGAGFRQGIAGVELEVRARLQYFLLAFGAEALLRFQVYEHGPIRIAPIIGGGIVANTGATWFDDRNFGAVSLRFLPGIMGTVQATETVTAIVQLEVPFELGLTPAGTNRFTAMGGGGVEVALDEAISVGVLALGGAERVKAPGRLDVWRPAYGVKLGLGFRIF